jgi:hypothetical protein
MNKLALAVAVTLALVGSSAMAHGHGGGWSHGGGWARGGGWSHGGGGWGGGRVYVAPRPYFAPRPSCAPRFAPRIVVGARRVYVPPVSYFPTLPFGAVSISVGAQPYYYGSGQFYMPSARGYVVVAPPIGAQVTELPYGATQQVINGYTYATYEGAWFVWDGRGAWVVVQAPF